MTSVDMEAQSGDSGRVVYTVKKNIAGIVQSGPKDGSNQMFYVKAGNINNYFNLVMY